MDTEVQTIPGYRPVHNDETGRTDYLLSTTLESPLSKTILENSNRKKFRIGNVKVKLPNGSEAIRSAICYEGNFKHADLEGKEMEVGQSYLTRLNFDDEGTPHLQLSHLTNANRSTKEDFDMLLTMSGEKKEQKAPIEKGVPTTP